MAPPFSAINIDTTAILRIITTLILPSRASFRPSLCLCQHLLLNNPRLPDKHITDLIRQDIACPINYVR
jgi:hypothetical protein